MDNVRLIARLDINNEYVIKGKYFEGLRKVGLPNELANSYYAGGIDEIIFLDAVASLYDRNSLVEIIKQACKEIFVPITVGGGIRTIKDIQDALNAGADKVAINSEAIRNIAFITEAVEIFGSQAIVGSIVARRHRHHWEAFMDNAKHRTHKDAVEWAKELESAGVGEIVVSSIDKDGNENGFEIELIKEISEAVKVPVIAASGAGSTEDIVQVCKETNCDAVAIASILHYQREEIANIKNSMAQKEIEVRL
jgi:imidazole glycerol-phosphate synthase subunit HisF